LLLGDSSKARRVLGWKPKVSFKDLVHLMVDHDLELARLESLRKRDGAEISQASWGSV
jgi:GDPmannose 4,6-dehydratase